MGWPVSMGRLPLVPSLPPAPMSLAVAAGANQNSINATAVNSYPAVLGFNIYAGATAGGESAVPIATNVSLPYIDSGLAAGITRFYKIAAVNGVGVGPLSSEASGTPTPPGSIPGICSTPPG
jgi:titin